MIPYLFSATYPNSSRIFTGHGLGDLVDATEVVAEENGEDGHEWELSFNYPETGPLFNQLVLNNIVVAKANNHQDLQAFRIYSITKNLNHMVTVACQHISYDLANIPTKPMEVTGVQTALTTLKANMINVCNKNNFVFATDISINYSSSKTYKVGDLVLYNNVLYKCTTAINTPESWNSSHWTSSISKAEKESVQIKFEEPQSALKVLLDGDDSIRGVYGGDLVTNNYDISLYEIGGQDRGVHIEYGIDLIDLDQERNITDMITGILPYYVRDKDIRLEIGLERQSDIKDVNGVMALNTEAYTLEAGSKYTLKFTPENSGGVASLSSASGFPAATFNMDGTEKEYSITPSVSITVAAGTSLIIAVTIPSTTEDQQTIYSPIGSINSFSIVKNYVEPILYGDVVNGPGVYEVQRISSVNLTEFFQDRNDEPTIAQITAKGQEWVNAEEIGVPEVSLTVSYASLENKDVRLYDAVQVKFLRMGIDVKSKITRYKYDVLAERCLEIDVGKTKESAIFTLQDASRLRKGLLPPDRIAKESLDGNKIKSGSIGTDQLGAGAVRKWNMPVDEIDHDLLADNAVTVRNLYKDDGSLPDGWCKDPVLRSVPANVYGGYRKAVGYLLDPSLGMTDDGFPGWTDSNDLFHPIVKDYDRNIAVDNKSGVGYVMNPDCIANGAITTPKIEDAAITGSKIADQTVDKDKFNTRTRDEWDEIAEKTANFGHLIGPQMAIDVTSDYYAIERLMATAMQAAYYQIDGATGFLMFPQQTGNTAYRVHTIYASDGTTALGYFISNTNITLPPDVSSDIAGIGYQITALWQAINGYTSGGRHVDGINDILADHESRISALES